MTRWPTVFESSVWPTPRAPVASAIPIIPATRPASRVVSCSGIAWSRTARSRKGETIPSPAEIRIRPRTAREARPVGAEEREQAAAVEARLVGVAVQHGSSSGRSRASRTSARPGGAGRSEARSARPRRAARAARARPRSRPSGPAASRRSPAGVSPTRWRRRSAGSRVRPMRPSASSASSRPTRLEGWMRRPSRELLLGERAGVAEEVEGGELLAAHPEALERGGEPPARGAGEAEDQQPAGRFLARLSSPLPSLVMIAANDYGNKSLYSPIVIDPLDRGLTP